MLKRLGTFILCILFTFAFVLLPPFSYSLAEDDALPPESGTGGSPAPIAVSTISITLYGESPTLAPGETLRLGAAISPDDATNQNVAWSSSNEAVAAIDSDGLLTALTEGTTVVRAAASDGEGAFDEVEITVAQQGETAGDAALSITFSGYRSLDEDGTAHYESEYAAGDEIELTPVFESNAETTYVWQIYSEADKNYIDISPEENPTCQESRLALTVEADMLEVEGLYRCAVTAARGDESLTKYACFTLRALSETEPELDGGEQPGMLMSASFLQLQENGYTYSVTDGKATILLFSGTGSALNIPATLGGYPVIAIAGSAFQCTYTSIAIPEGVTQIGDAAFSASTAATISLPSTVTQIGPRALNLMGLESIAVAAGNANYCAVDGVLYSKNLDTIVSYPSAKAGDSYSIPDSVVTVYAYAFLRANNLTRVEFGDNSHLQTIGEYAFGGSGNFTMTTLSLPASVREIGPHAFESQSALTKVFINGPLNTIGAYCFASCHNLYAFYSYDDAPATCSSTAFWDVASDFHIYYESGATGWQTPLWNGWPCGVYEAITSLSITGADSVHMENRIPLAAVVTPSGASVQTVLWDMTTETGNAEIVNGYLYGLAEGTVTLTARIRDVFGDVTCTKTITVLPAETDPLISEILLSAAHNYVPVGNTLSITTSVYPTAAHGAIAWRVENGTGSATVSSAGVVTGVSEGTVTVYAQASDGSGVQASYPLTVLSEASIDLTAITAAPPATTFGYTIGSDGTIALGSGIQRFIITGTSTKYSILADCGGSVDLILQNLSMNMLGNGLLSPIRISAGTNADVTILGTVNLQSSEGAGIEVAENAGVTITSDSTGVLQTPSTPVSVGGAQHVACGSVEIDGGTIVGTHIGAGQYADGSDVLITGGNITVSSIGAQYLGDGGNITITGGTITASHIGGGYMGSGGTIRISGGYVNVSAAGTSAAIGGGDGGAGGQIAINGGTVCALSTGTGAGIGGGRNGSGGAVAINGGNVRAAGGSGAMDIGSGTSGISSGTLRNTAGSAVYLVTLNYGSPNTTPETMSLEGVAEEYGVSDFRSQSDGVLYFYLPAGTASALIDGKLYEADIQTDQENMFLLASYPVTLVLDGLVSSNTETFVNRRATFTTTLGAESEDFLLPLSITVTLGSNTLTAGQGYSYDSETGALCVPNVTANLTITAAADRAYSLTTSLTGLTTDDPGDKLRAGTEHTVRLYPVTDHDALPAAVTVTMGGFVLMESEYTYDRLAGEISIPNITGDVFVFAESIQVPDSCRLSSFVYAINGGADRSIDGFAANVLVYEINLPADTPEDAVISLAPSPADGNLINYDPLSIQLSDGLADVSVAIRGDDGLMLNYELHFYIGVVTIDLANLANGAHRGYTVTDSTIVVSGAKYDYLFTGAGGRSIVLSTSGDVRVTLQNAAVDTTTRSAAAIAVASGTRVNLILIGENSLAGGTQRAGIDVPDGAELSISGESTGSVYVVGGWGSAGIGGSYQRSCGTITINGGNVTAYSGSYDTYTGWSWQIGGAGIGAAYGGTIAPEIIINGGVVKAYGCGSAGIGSCDWTAAGSITINGGDVTASAIISAAGIGGGQATSGGGITINGGTIHASCDYVGTGIGSMGTNGTVRITNGVVYATGGTGLYDSYSAGPGIGGAGGKVIISGGWVKATGGDGAAGIGGENGQTAGHIVISGGQVYACGGYGGNSGAGAGIGGGGSAECGSILISGGTIAAYGGYSKSGFGAPGIGSGGYGTNLGYGNGDGIVQISDGFVQAFGALNAAGIGGGWNAAGTTVVITGGAVDARSELVSTDTTDETLPSDLQDASAGTYRMSLMRMSGVGIGIGLADQAGAAAQTVSTTGAKAKNIGNGSGDQALKAGTLKNGSVNVYLTKLYIGKANASIDSAQLELGGAAEGYSTSGMRTDRDGYLRLYLPTGKAWVKYEGKASTVTVYASENNLFTRLAAIPITSLTLNKTSQAVFVGETIDLAATWAPVYTTVEPIVVWTSSNPSVATVADGTVTALSGGTATITASIGGKSAACVVKVIVPAESILISGATQMLGGASTQMQASVYPSDATNKAVTWSLSSESAAFASISATGLLTAKNVSEINTVSVWANAKDGSGVEAEYIVTVVPRALGITISREGETSAVNGTSVTLDLNRTDAGGEKIRQWQFGASVYPSDAGQVVIWQSSAPSVASVDGKGLVTINQAGTATISVMAADGSKTTAKFTVRVAALSQSIAFFAPTETLLGGKGAVYRVCDAETSQVLPSSAVKWSVEEGAVYASINAGGKLTTRAVSEKTDVILRASVVGNSEIANKELTVTLYPAVTQVQIMHDETIVNGKTLSLNVAGRGEGNAPVLELGKTLYPSDAMQGVVWSTSAKSIAAVDANGAVTPVWNALAGRFNTGTVTITCKATDGSGRSAQVKVQVGIMAENVDIQLPLGAEPVVRSGSYLQLAAAVTPADATIKSVKWQLKDSGDSAYVTLNASGRLTAKTVYDTHTITVTATSNDALQASDEIEITIKPKTDDILILKADGSNVTQSVLMLNAHEGNPVLTLTAYQLNAAEPETAVWKSSAPAVAAVDAAGVVTLYRTGTATITASAGGRTASVTIKGAMLASEIIVSAKAAAPVVASGKTLALQATVLPATTANKTVSWSIPAEYADFARISASGLLTATANLTAQKVIAVSAAAKDGSGVSAVYSITINPLSTGVVIQSDGMAINQTTQILDMSESTTASFASVVYPANASQAVIWTSSNKNIALIDSSNGAVTALRPGTVTITAKAADGSGKSASFRLSIIKRITGLTLPGTAGVASGKSIALLPTINPGDATNKKLQWSMTGDTAFATLSSTGVLKAKVVTGQKTVVVTAAATDGSGKSVRCEVTIYPFAVTAVQIFDSQGVQVTGKTLTLAIGETLNLHAVNLPSSAYQKWTWKSSSAALASVTQTSGGATITALKAGYLTITAASSDGSGKAAVVKIHVI